MDRMISITTAAEFADALEDWIIKNKCNPQTPEEWNKCVNDMLDAGILTPLGCLEEKDVPEFKEKLKENLKVEEL